jgi:hypothetical protein
MSFITTPPTMFRASAPIAGGLPYVDETQATPLRL